MNFNFPSFTNFNKFFLVEELALAENPAEIHYGKCNIIGFLSSHEYLQSISIPKVKSEYQLPDGAISLRIYAENYPANLLKSTVRIYGEVRLYDPDKEVTLNNFESSHTLLHKLREFQMCLEKKLGIEREPSGTNDKGMNFAVRIKLEKEINAMKLKYLPIIHVTEVRHIQSAREIIVENLNFRQIQNMRKNSYSNSRMRNLYL